MRSINRRSAKVTDMIVRLSEGRTAREQRGMFRISGDIGITVGSVATLAGIAVSRIPCSRVVKLEGISIVPKIWGSWTTYRKLTTTKLDTIEPLDCKTH